MCVMCCVICVMCCVLCIPLCQGLRTQPSKSCLLRACEISSCQARALHSTPDVNVVVVDVDGYDTILIIKCGTSYQFLIIRVIGGDRGWQ